MSVFSIAGRKVQVDTYQTPWPASVFFKQQGVRIQVNPQTHWWCAWLCTTTDNADAIDCAIELKSVLVPPVTARNSCTRCGDLTVRGSGSVGFSGPWPFQSVEFKGTVRFPDGAGTIAGALVYS
jgi:hypothetical protein